MAARIFSNIAAAHIIVDMIVQNASIGGTTDVSFTIHEDELENARTILMPVIGQIGAKRLNTAAGVAKLSVVGIGMTKALSRILGLRRKRRHSHGHRSSFSHFGPGAWTDIQPVRPVELAQLVCIRASPAICR